MSKAPDEILWKNLGEANTEQKEDGDSIMHG